MKSTLLFFFLLFSSLVLAQDTQTFLSIKQTGVEEFLSKHPQYDGSGTIIFILDTGVDMTVEGLLKTPEGKTKIIDVRDFTGEGDLKMYEADVDDNSFVNKKEKLSVKGADKIKSKDGKYFIGALTEKGIMNTGSGQSDLNGNGKNDDSYTFVAFMNEQNEWIIYFDTNDDGSLADEKPLKEYYKNFDFFTIKNAKTNPPFGFAINVYPAENRLSLFFDDGAHGTHCAGIASGYNISGSYVKGIAPGANVIGLKIGNNNYPGGATVTESMKRAYLYADSVSKARKEPCIINMSFGTGSEIEGTSEMEKFFADLLKKNQYLYVCISNGNEGPGISSTGLPSSSPWALSSGAYLTSEVARDLYGSTLSKDEIWNFSSRGGEVNKPDIVSPGASVSTVPFFSYGDRMQGTSMASPYSTGVVALLMSAVIKEYPDVKVPSQLVFRAIRESATKLEGYSILDQGHGLINANNAWETLKKYIEAKEVDNIEKYTTTSFAPNQPDNKAPNLYIRDGSYISGKETFSFEVKRDEMQKGKSFYRIYNLSSDSDWLLPVQKKTYIRNNASVYVNVTIDRTKMKNPGVYAGRIKALRDDKTKMPEFELQATVVIPYEFDESTGYAREWKNEKVNQGIMKSYFIKYPAGATTMNIKMNKSGKEYARTMVRLFNPDGQQVEIFPALNTVNNDNSFDKTLFNLAPGIYEVIVEGPFVGTSVSTYDMSISFNGLNRTDHNNLTLTERNIALTNYFDKVFTAAVKGEIEGYSKVIKADLNGKGSYKMPFNISSKDGAKVFTVQMSKEDYGKVTDFTMQITDSTGKAVQKTSFSYSQETLEFNNKLVPKNGAYTLELVPAFTNATDTMIVIITEQTDFDAPKEFRIKNSSSKISFYPSITKYLTLDYGKADLSVPEGTKLYGKLSFEQSDLPVYELPLQIDPLK